IEVELVDLRDRAHVTWDAVGYLRRFLAHDAKQMRDTERLARIASKELAARPHGALVHTEDAELADVRVDTHLEYVRDDVVRGICGDRYAFRLGFRALEERRRVAFAGVRHEPNENVEQLRNARARFRRHEAHGHEMAFPQRLLERIVQLYRRELLALLEIQRHQLFVDLDDLIDDLRVRRLHGREIRRLAMRLEEAVHDGRAAFAREVERQAFGTEQLAHGAQRRFGMSVLAVDLVDDDQPAQPAVAGEFHESLADRVDGRAHADDDHGRFDGFQHRVRAAEEICVSGCVDQREVRRAGVEGTERRVDRMLKPLLLRVEVRNRRPARQAALRADGPRLQQQGLEEQRLARTRRAHEGDVADVLRRVAHGEYSRGRYTLVLIYTATASLLPGCGARLAAKSQGLNRTSDRTDTHSGPADGITGRVPDCPG